MPTPSEQQEARRRMDVAIARARVHHMSNTKWRKLFATLWEMGGIRLRWKFVRDERIFTEGSPSPSNILDEMLGDTLPSPYGAYREIEWVEVALAQADRVEQALAQVGQYPLVRCATGLRVIAYEW
jgi:hypothetical protein